MRQFPEIIKEPVRKAIIESGDSTAIHSVHLVGGGCINNAVRLETERNVYFLKWNAAPPPRMFQCEAQGLALLSRTGALRVPNVLAVAEADGSQPAYILLEWLEPGNDPDQGRLGEQMDRLHIENQSVLGSSTYGLDHDNFIGLNQQVNHWETSWPRFFTESRIRPQVELARQNGHLSPERRKRLEVLIERIPSLLDGVKRRPSLIHGDLWSGNVVPGPDGLAVVDPAVSYSDREAEIAFTELFGGFSRRFYTAYEATWPLEPGYRDRRDLYNLYHLLNHLNLFGENYGYQVDAILRRYVG